MLDHEHENITLYWSPWENTEPKPKPLIVYPINCYDRFLLLTFQSSLLSAIMEGWFSELIDLLLLYSDDWFSFMIN